MKVIFLVLFALACLLAVSNAQKKKCDRGCAQVDKPVCATANKGKTYRRFSNQCLLDIENCKTKNAYKKTDLRKCKK